MNIFSILTLLILLVACGTEKGESQPEQRWYSSSQVEMGRVIFKNNCAICHKDNAEGTANWKETLADGSLPPPPLNGSAHAWHHSLKVLRDYIKGGGAPFGGQMPAFGEKLSDSEVDSAIAYFQSYWNAEIYNT